MTQVPERLDRRHEQFFGGERPWAIAPVREYRLGTYVIGNAVNTEGEDCDI